jgi:hypothetical protein
MKRFALSTIFILQFFVAIALPRAKRVHTRRANTRHSLLFFTNHNSFVAETSVNFERDTGSLMVTHPSLLLRYGVLGLLEFRLGVDIATVKDLNTNRFKSGLMPLQPGLKIQFNRAHKFLPAFTLTGSVVIPMAASPIMQQTYFAPYIIAGAEQDITKKLSFEYDAALQWDADNFHRIYSGIINCEYDITSRSTFYGDLYVIKEDGSGWDIRADLGFNQTITPALQFDLSAGYGFTSSAPQFFLTAGLYFSVQGKGKRNGLSPKAITSPGLKKPLPVH